MRAIRVKEWTDPVVFHLEDHGVPQPGPGEVSVRVHTAAVNFGDALIATGRYQVKPSLPFTPGGECAGIIENVGAGVIGFKPGDRVFVMGFIGRSRESQRIVGAFSEDMIAPITNVALIPEGMPLDEAALFRTNYETSYYGLQQGALKPGETLLVLGAGGATGRAAVELGKAMGAYVIASASSEGRRQIALDGGADVAIDGRAADWRDQVKAITKGRGIDVIYDPVGGKATEQAFRSVAWGGRLVIIGFAAGDIPSLPANLPLMKGASIIGANFLRMMEEEPEHAARNFQELLDMYGAGELKMPPIARSFPIEQAREAVDAVLGGQVDGRVVLRMSGE